MVIRRAPGGSFGDAWSARVEDWMEEGSRITRLDEEYRRHYRATVCARCTLEQQARRKCAALTRGCSTKSCSHMNRAFCSKHRKIIRAHLWSHPLTARILLNRRLEDARRGHVG